MSDSGDKRWVVFMRDDCVADTKNKEEAGSTKFLKLRHPHSGCAAMFMYSGKRLCEMIKFEEAHRSWIVGDWVSSEGGVYLATPVDPLYILLPYLTKSGAGGKFVPLDQIVCDREFQEAGEVTASVSAEQLENVAEAKGPDDLRVYRYEEARTLSWLSEKVHAVCETIKAKHVDIKGGSISATYVKSKKNKDNSDEDTMRYAYDIVDKYLPTEVGAKLKKHLGIKDPVPVVHEKPTGDEPPAKKAKTDGPEEDYSINNKKQENKKMTRTTLAQKQLEKVDKSGMKSMSSFFSAKPKKPV